MFKRELVVLHFLFSLSFVSLDGKVVVLMIKFYNENINMHKTAEQCNERDLCLERISCRNITSPTQNVHKIEVNLSSCSPGIFGLFLTAAQPASKCMIVISLN